MSLLHVLGARCLFTVWVDVVLFTSPPEGIAMYCFHSVCVCPANILVFYFSAIRRDIDMNFIQDTYSDTVVLDSLTKLTFIS